jgi:hypothetical protein
VKRRSAQRRRLRANHDLSWGLEPSPVDPMTLMITLRDAEQALISKNRA